MLEQTYLRVLDYGAEFFDGYLDDDSSYSYYLEIGGAETS